MKKLLARKYFISTHNNFGTDENILLALISKNIINENMLALIIILVQMKIFYWHSYQKIL
jgi:hypothetical protein